MQKILILVILLSISIISSGQFYPKKRKIESNSIDASNSTRVIATNYIWYGAVQTSIAVLTKIQKIEKDLEVHYIFELCSIASSSRDLQLSTHCFTPNSRVNIKCEEQVIELENMNDGNCGNNIYFSSSITEKDVEILKQCPIDVIRIYYNETYVDFKGLVSKNRNSKISIIEAFDILK